MKIQECPFAGTHRQSPFVVGVRLVVPIPVAVVEIEVGSLGTTLSPHFLGIAPATGCPSRNE